MTFKECVMSGKCIDSLRILFQKFRCSSKCVCCNSVITDSIICDTDVMEPSSFYVTLPSNASTDVYPGNSPSSFQIRLPRTMYLKNKYEVALAEMQYPHAWNTFTNVEDYQFQVELQNKERVTFTATPGYYKNIGQLVDDLNKQFEEEFRENFCITFKHNVFLKRIKLILKDNCSVIFNQGLADVLGFEAYKLYSDSCDSIYHPDIYRGFHTIYVYCNICEPQVVGNYYVPLLRAVNISGKDGDMVNKVYNEPHYVPVNTTKFDVIEIELKNDSGENVSFKTGKVVCKLHFRQKAL